jgi:hypothetical protein
MLWQKAYGGSSSDVPTRVISTTDGGYMLIGSTISNDGDVSGNHGQSDIWLIKINQEGTILWQKTYGGSYADDGNSIIQTNDGGYIILGATNSTDFDVPGNNHGGTDLWVFKINGNGDMVWNKLFGGNNTDYSNVIISTVDGGYVIGGRSASINGDVPGNHGNFDSWIIKIDSIGTIQWKTDQGGTNADHCNSIGITDDGGYLVLGSSASKTGQFAANHGNFDFWVYKLSATGNFEWQKFYGGTNYDTGEGMIKLKNGNFVLVGDTQSTDGDLIGNTGTSAWMVCIDQNGGVVWKKTYGGSQSDGFVKIAELDNGDFIVIGASNSTDGDVQSGQGSLNGTEIWVVHMSTTTGVEDAAPALNKRMLAPNPASNYIEIFSKETLENCTVSIYSLDGIVVGRQPLPSNRKIDLSALSPGVYVLEIACQGKTSCNKVIKM